MSSVITATLVRGKIYTYHNPGEAGKAGTYHEFHRNVPVEVSEELADKLENLTDDVPLADRERRGEMVTVDLFKINRDASSLDKPSEKPKMRLRLVPASEKPAAKPVTQLRKNNLIGNKR